MLINRGTLPGKESHNFDCAVFQSIHPFTHFRILNSQPATATILIRG